MGNLLRREQRRQQGQAGKQSLGNNWQILTSNADPQSPQTYYITDAKHGRSVCGSDNFDGQLYHQDPTDRPNAKWVFEPVSTNPGFYNIRDIAHIKYIVASDDGRVYHQDNTGQLSAMWRMVVFTDAYGSTTFFLMDGEYNKAIVANDVDDSNLFNQDPNGRPNARWALIPCPN